MSDMHLLAAAKSLLSHPPLPWPMPEPWRRWKRKRWGRRGSASPRYGTSPSLWRTRKPDTISWGMAERVSGGRTAMTTGGLGPPLSLAAVAQMERLLTVSDTELASSMISLMTSAMMVACS